MNIKSEEARHLSTKGLSNWKWYTSAIRDYYTLRGRHATSSTRHLHIYNDPVHSGSKNNGALKCDPIPTVFLNTLAVERKQSIYSIAEGF